ncbi:hypothetical protein D083_2004 [Dickeya solani RNS 08.23.3.1.A]|nr:hypothetical protein D083_2004 [Dickeya solani RNS 08.23.3.1.A]
MGPVLHFYVNNTRLYFLKINDICGHSLYASQGYFPVWM